ncbi:hypothetical protein ID866_7489 [Astraeus odoratus]|nr:hypothetical protein ID866_7489 [Astraeus odoratus]
MPEPSAAFAHIISQTRQNVELLIAHHQISEADGRDILARLPTTAAGTGPSIVALAEKASRLSMSSHARRSPSLSAPTKVEARALWSWEGDNPNDLSLRVGEIIQIVTQTNADWWTGRNRAGKEGLFPAAYVEKIGPSLENPPPAFPDGPKSDTASVRPGSAQRYPSPTPSQQPYASSVSGNHYFSPPSGPPQPHGSPGSLHRYSSYSYGPPPGAPPNQYGPPPGAPQLYGPPPGGQGYYAPPAGQTSPAPQLAPAQKPPSGKLNNLGETMAQSAAQGVGWGAGAAIGSGIVHSIF